MAPAPTIPTRNTPKLYSVRHPKRVCDGNHGVVVLKLLQSRTEVALKRGVGEKHDLARALVQRPHLHRGQRYVVPPEDRCDMAKNHRLILYNQPQIVRRL